MLGAGDMPAQNSYRQQDQTPNKGGNLFVSFKKYKKMLGFYQKKIISLHFFPTVGPSGKLEKANWGKSDRPCQRVSLTQTLVKVQQGLKRVKSNFIEVSI